MYVSHNFVALSRNISASNVILTAWYSSFHEAFYGDLL